VDADSKTLRNALASAGYAPNNTSTVKYHNASTARYAWEQGTMAKHRFDRGGEIQQHCYWFAGHSGMHVHHHREWPIAHPRKHQSGSRTPGDPGGELRAAVSEIHKPTSAIPDHTRAYVPTTPYQHRD
jgi:hypothetical protein